MPKEKGIGLEKENQYKKEYLEQKLKALPNKSGVYIMKDKDDNIIYVGKAVVLKNRVRQYFRKNNKSSRIENMVANIADFEYIVTDTEDEALLLESNLIKKHSPKFNILLKDDKTYPYIKLDRTDYPSFFFARKKDGISKYYGPYTSSKYTNEVLEVIYDNFSIRRCKNFKYRKKPCIYYDLKRCPGCCIKGLVDKDEYAKTVKEISNILAGNSKGIIRVLEEKMEHQASLLKFEKAQEIKNQIESLKRIGIKQKVANFSYNTLDALGIYVKNDTATALIFKVRGGKLFEKKTLQLQVQEDETLANIQRAILKQYYLHTDDIPEKIYIQKSDLEQSEIELFEKILTAKNEKGGKIQILMPQKGQKQLFLEMALENAKISYELKKQKRQYITSMIEKALDIPSANQIEIYDISNIGDNNIVGAMVVAKDGKISKKDTRVFKIPIEKQDDFLSTKLMLLKRLNHTLEGKEGLGNLPDLIIADGGIQHINSIKKAIDMLGLEIPVFGLVKDQKHTTKDLIDDNGNIIIIPNEVRKLFTTMQEHVHNKAVEYMQKSKSKDLTKSILDNIPGIGTVKKQNLLKHFKSVDKIQKASVDEIAKVSGISKTNANDIYEFFKKQNK